MREQTKNLKILGLVMLAVFVLTGIFLRCYRITQNEFFFYDEGYYLSYHREFLEALAQIRPVTFQEHLRKASYFFKFSLATGKALYFLLFDSRVFWGHIEDWFVPRVISAVAGILTLPLVFLFARRYYHSVAVAAMATMILAVFPGHVFYSRLAMQEASSTLFFVAGMYFYVFPPRLGWRTFCSSLLMCFAFFCNYRLIFIPVFMLFTEVYLKRAGRETPDMRKWFWHSLVFTFLVFMIGGLYEGGNTVLIFGWMFYQAHLAKETALSFLNFFSYPYYLFRLESALFAAVFFGNILYFIKRQWRKGFFLALYILAVLYFSFAMEKGARYACVFMPFMAMGVAALIHDVWQMARSPKARMTSALVFVLLVGHLAFRANRVAHFRSDYRTAVVHLEQREPDVKFLSTQPYVQRLYVDEPSRVLSAPKEYRTLLALYANGYRYLVLDPQLYISWTRSGRRFEEPLVDYLQFVSYQVRPRVIYSHFSPAMIERFVFDHNQNLAVSLRFLDGTSRVSRAIRVYNIADILRTIQARTSGMNDE